MRRRSPRQVYQRKLPGGPTEMRVRRKSVEKWDKWLPGDPEVPGVDWSR